MYSLAEILSQLFALAGGGGSSSGGGGGGGGSSDWGYYGSDSTSSSPISLAVSLIFAIIMIGVFIWLHFRAKQLKAEKARQLTASMALARGGDEMWNKELIEKLARDLFPRYQQSWQNFDMLDIRKFTTPEYASHVNLMLLAMKQMHRKNVVSEISLQSVAVIDFEDNPDNRLDRMTVEYTGSARDSLVDTVSDQQIFSKIVQFTEYWHFNRVGNSWILNSISQSTESAEMTYQHMMKFAKANDMYFSPDWGSLLLPVGGELFKHGFDSTDINNHIIGYWQGDLLVQIYTYSYRPGEDAREYHIVGQISLPKTYGGILVERVDERKSKRWKAPVGYELVSTEWGDFNQRYKVYATDRNQVVSLELLNPGFMAWLYDQNLRCNIEVIGNSVFFSSRVSSNQGRYPEMLEILKRSYKELKM